MFHLPKTTELSRIIPKNAFNNYTNTRQKNLFTDMVLRITWKSKVSQETTNLPQKEIEEIQVFEIALKEKAEPKELLHIIQRAIPYPIIFQVVYNNEYYLSVSIIHRKVNNENETVIDYTYSSDWLAISSMPFTLELKNDLDWVYKNFCEQFSDQGKVSSSLQELAAKQIEREKGLSEIALLKKQIYRCKQFNQKVELNRKLKELKKKYKIDPEH